MTLQTKVQNSVLAPSIHKPAHSILCLFSVYVIIPDGYTYSPCIREVEDLSLFRLPDTVLVCVCGSLVTDLSEHDSEALLSQWEATWPFLPIWVHGSCNLQWNEWLLWMQICAFIGLLSFREQLVGRPETGVCWGGLYLKRCGYIIMPLC